MRCCKLLPLIYGKRYNAVCAIGSEGLLALAFYLRANNLDTMMHFFMFHLFSEVSPVMQAFPGDRSVLILDNASYHHAEQDLVTRFCQSKGVRVHFLPPYSPDFNPIGGTFDATRPEPCTLNTFVPFPEPCTLDPFEPFQRLTFPV